MMKSNAPTTQPSDGRCQFDSPTSLAAKDSDWKATPPSCQILRAGRDAHYWQIQYYPEPLTLEDEWTKSVDISFAQTLKEEDDLFYRTFPAARSSLGSSRQWSSLAMSSPHFQGSTGFYIQPTSVGQSERSFQVDSDGDATMCSSVEQPNFTSELLGAIRSPSAMRRDVDQIGVESSASKCKGEKIASVQEQLYGADASCVVGVTTHPISRRMSTDMDLDIDARYLAEDPPMGRLSPPPHGLDSSSPSEEHGLMVSNSSVKEEFSPIQDLNQIPSPTGTWSSLRMRSQSQTDWSNLTPSPTLRSPSDPTTLTSYGRRPSDSPSSMPSPSISTGPKPEPVETAGPSVMRLSPLPANRRPAERKKTQTLACQFCRHRKIACGPPRSGTTERTCNQCQRRSLECVFPTESRRGMRKKKAQTTQKSTSSSPNPRANVARNQSTKSDSTQNTSGSESSSLPQEGE